MIDCHCHLNDREFAGREEEIIALAKDAGVEIIICVGVNLESSKKAIELAGKYPGVYATVGIHPEEIAENSEELKQLASRPKVVAIGETGLDMKDPDMEKQKELLTAQAKLAGEFDLPLVVHNRQADKDILEILKDQKKVMMHCFTGDLELMQECVKRGWYISFGGIITFSKSEGLREVVRMTPEERILVETDAPYLAPEPMRGSVNTPTNVKIVARIAAEVRGISLDRIDQITTTNARRLFKI